MSLACHKFCSCKPCAALWQKVQQEVQMDAWEQVRQLSSVTDAILLFGLLEVVAVLVLQRVSHMVKRVGCLSLWLAQ